MLMRVEIKPELLRWTRKRAGKKVDELSHKFKKYREWESGNAQPTLKQLEELARIVRAPVGYFFLSKPPDEPLFPIPDFRTMGGKSLGHPSLDLRDTIYLCQQRQDWYREFASMEGEEPLAFVGSQNTASNIETAAANIRKALHLDLEEDRSVLRDKADKLGVLVMVSGIVGSNTRRGLDPSEFRGFALADNIAPLVFINGADTKAAQMFTLAHELAHLWLNETALSNSCPDALPTRNVRKTEAWCNRVAAELLVPLAVLRKEYQSNNKLEQLARHFKVSMLVILRRIHDAGILTQEEFRQAYDNELNKLKDVVPRGGGGDFYRTQTSRIGRRFARAIVTSTLEGDTSFTEAFQLLCFRRMKTFDEFARRLEITA